MSSIVVITGANRGVGLALAEHYQQEEWKVIGVCRQTSDELERVADNVIEDIDVTQDDDIARLSAASKQGAERSMIVP